jgi:DNA-binding transcriptional LysR family regulator
MLEGVTIEQLRTLRAVAEAGSFSAAARKLGRAQAGISQAIDRLEAQLGLRLFDRSGRVPRLTRHGEAIVAAAGKVGGEVDALDALVESLKRGSETTLSIIVDLMFPTTSLVAFANDFAREHPTVELMLFTDILSAVTAHVREKRSSWGIAIEDADLSGLDRRHVADVRLIPVAAPTHPLAVKQKELGEKGSIDTEALAGLVQIVLAEHRPDGDNGSEDQGVFSHRTWRVVDLATKLALITSGLGWGQMPEHLVRQELSAGKLVELRLEALGGEGMRRSLALVWRRGIVMGPVAKWAQEHLSKLCLQAISASSAESAAPHHTA